MQPCWNKALEARFGHNHKDKTPREMDATVRTVDITSSTLDIEKRLA